MQTMCCYSQKYYWADIIIYQVLANNQLHEISEKFHTRDNGSQKKHFCKKTWMDISMRLIRVYVRRWIITIADINLLTEKLACTSVYWFLKTR